MVLRTKYFLGVLLLQPLLSGFVLLSGPSEAKLPVTRTSPVLSFRLHPTAPKIQEKEKVFGGQYATLSDDEFYVTLVQEVLQIWNSIEGAYIQLDVQTDANAVISFEDGEYVIAKDDLPATAAASAHPNVEEALIKDCDIVIGDRTTSAESLAFTMLHEIGHCLGLGHNHTNYAAVMGYSRTNQALRLAADDKAGIIYLYPSVEGDVKEIVPCGMIGAANGTGFGWWLVSPLLVVWLSSRRRDPSLRSG